jgi:hypothetical protein
VNIEDSRKLWSVTAKIADLAGVWQALLFVGPIGAIVAARWLELFGSGPVAGVALSGSAMVFGVIGGVVVVHPKASRMLIRRQTEYEITRFDVTGKFESGSRHPSSWKQERVIKALREGVSEVHLFFGYGSESDTINIRVTKGGKLVRRIDADGRWFIEVLLDRTLKKGEEIVVCTRLIVPDHAQDCPPYCTVTPQTLMSNVTIHLDFDGHDPRSVWSTYWVSDVSAVKCLKKIIKPSADGSYAEKLKRTKPGHRYGLTWEWE